MSFWRQAIDKPQPLFLRRALFQIHLWAGLAIGVWAFLIGLSGSILVFQESIDAALNHSAVPSFAPEQRNATSEELMRSVRERFPSGLLHIGFPYQPGGYVIANNYNGSQAHTLLLNPHNAVVLSIVDHQGTLLQMIGRFHSNLFLGRPGRILNGVLGVVTLLMAATGIVIWWPGIAQWRRRLIVNFRAPWRLLMFELHNAAGFWCLFYIALSAFTGAYFTWPQQYRAAVSFFSPVTERPNVRLDAPPDAARRPLDEVVAAAERAAAGKAEAVDIFTNRNQPVRVLMPGRVTVAVNPFTAEVLDVERPSSKTAGDILMRWMGPLHTGHFGGLKIAVLWAVLGLSLPLLFVTGFLMWWNRVIAKRL